MKPPTTLVPPPRDSASARRRALVADDDTGMLRTIERILTKADFDVVTADNGSAAIDIVMAERFDVILSDIHMPGMTGVDLLRVVRAYDLDVPVVLMTGRPNVETAVEALELGALRYLRKPVDAAELVSAVERAARLNRLAQTKREARRSLGANDAEPGDRAGLIASFDRALQGLWMAFQPIVSVRGKRVVGYEALMRTQEPSLSTPAAILDAAERLNQLPELGRRVRKLVAGAFRSAPEEALLFVNVHVRDLLDPDLASTDAPLSAFAGRVILEITERAQIDAIRDLETRVRLLRYLGFRIALDDLGAGYAGLASFARLEPDFVKLDISLVRDLHLSPVRQKVVGSMTSLCDQLGMTMIAEGVESDEERVAVRDLGCDLVQGRFFAEPGPALPRVSW